VPLTRVHIHWSISGLHFRPWPVVVTIHAVPVVVPIPIRPWSGIRSASHPRCSLQAPQVPVVIPVRHCQLLDLLVALAVFCKHQQVPIVVMPIPVCSCWLLDPPVALVVRWKRPQIPVAVVVIACHRPRSCPSKSAVSCDNHPHSLQAPASSSRRRSCSRISC
jgi:hypothetical protein